MEKEGIGRSHVATGAPLSEKDWQTFSEAVSEPNQTQRDKSLKSFSQYLQRENKLSYFASILHECSAIIEEGVGTE